MSSSYYCVLYDPLTCVFSFFFNDTATTEIYPLSLHDALPISRCLLLIAYCLSARFNRAVHFHKITLAGVGLLGGSLGDRKSTRLNSSHLVISYAVFCLKKQKLLSALHVRDVNLWQQHANPSQQ